MFEKEQKYAFETVRANSNSNTPYLFKPSSAERITSIKLAALLLAASPLLNTSSKSVVLLRPMNVAVLAGFEKEVTGCSSRYASIELKALLDLE